MESAGEGAHAAGHVGRPAVDQLGDQSENNQRTDRALHERLDDLVRVGRRVHHEGRTLDLADEPHGVGAVHLASCDELLQLADRLRLRIHFFELLTISQDVVAMQAATGANDESGLGHVVPLFHKWKLCSREYDSRSQTKEVAFWPLLFYSLLMLKKRNTIIANKASNVNNKKWLG